MLLFNNLFTGEYALNYKILISKAEKRLTICWRDEEWLKVDRCLYDFWFPVSGICVIQS